MDLVLEGRFFIDGELKQTAVGIEDGKIVTVGKIVRGGDERIDLGSRIAFPGFIDPHVHFRDPGLTHKEDFASGTMSALHGGVTCVLDMPNTSPPVTDVKTILEKKRAIRNKAFTDYGLFAALTPDAKIDQMQKHVAGFKLFMGSTTGNILMNDDKEIEYLMSDIYKSGKV
ncbi:MAG: dihydroorotase family protein, partial [Candidatus Methanomethylophilaceae archaeon]|nr:dihydroorotase family protein [Candidatus Methanomethylophilaceae archaeon]